MPVQLASAASRSCTSCTSSGGEWCLPLRRDMKSCFGDVPKQPFYPDLYSDIQGYITCRVIQGGPCTSRDMAGYRFQMIHFHDKSNRFYFISEQRPTTVTKALVMLPLYCSGLSAARGWASSFNLEHWVRTRDFKFENGLFVENLKSPFNTGAIYYPGF